LTADIEDSVELPPCPADFECHYHENLESPEPFFPGRCPRSAYYVVTVGWWSDAPISAPSDTYYLSTDRHRTRWFLWLSVWDSDEGIQRRDVWAYGPRAGVPPEVAAMHLLMTCWKNWSEGKPPGGLSVLGEGLLSAGQLDAIARELWPGSTPESRYGEMRWPMSSSWQSLPPA
jgi:hypothetical protein